AALAEIGETNVEAGKRMISWGLTKFLKFIGAKDHDPATLEEACREPGRCPPGTNPPGPRNAEATDPRKPVEIQAEDLAKQIGEKGKESLDALLEKLQERRESANDIAEANQFVNMSLLIQSIADPMSAYTDPMVRDFMGKFKVEFPAARIPVKSEEEAKALTVQFREMMGGYANEVKSGAEVSGVLSLGKFNGSKKTPFNTDTDDEDTKNKMSLGQILIKDKRIFKYNDTVSTKFYRKISSNGQELVVNTLVGTDRFFANPWFSVDSLRYVMNGAVTFARDRNHLFKAMTSPVGTGIFNVSKQIIVRMGYIIARVALGGMADAGETGGRSGGFGNNNVGPNPNAAAIGVAGSTVGAVDNLATTTPHIRSFTDKMLKWSEGGGVPVETQIGKYKINTELNFNSVLVFLFILQSIKQTIYLGRVMMTTTSKTAKWNALMRSVSEIAHARFYVPAKFGWQGLKNSFYNIRTLLSFPFTKSITGLRATVTESTGWRRFSKTVFWYDILTKVHNNFRPEAPLPDVGDLMFNILGHQVVNLMTKGMWAVNHLGAVDRFSAQVLRAENIVGLRHTNDLRKCGEKDIIELNGFFEDEALETYQIANVCETWKEFSSAIRTTATGLQKTSDQMEKMKLGEQGRMAVELYNDRVKSIALAMIRIHYTVSLSNFNSTQPGLATRLQLYAKTMDGMRIAQEKYFKYDPNYQVVNEAILSAKIPVIIDANKGKDGDGDKDKDVNLKPDLLKSLDTLLEKNAANN
ncbi:MAG: hypothetical protein K2X47_08615, partial [Bdellovibrionales bacterium]|nr:hypothetical protein [Bdellovibrionales bacterium]